MYLTKPKSHSDGLRLKERKYYFFIVIQLFFTTKKFFFRKCCRIGKKPYICLIFLKKYHEVHNKSILLEFDRKQI